MKNRNKTLIIASIIFLALAGLAILIGGSLAGWNFKEFFTSSTAYAIYVLIGVYILFLLYFFGKDFINRM